VYSVPQVRAGFNNCFVGWLSNARLYLIVKPLHYC
jgi:hypothetical protein